MEKKTVPFVATKVDEAEGIVESVVAVFGVIDEGNDRIWPGAFTKTITEQGHKVRVLDQHRHDTTMAAVGRPLELREIGREELPAQLLQRYPEATGGLLARTKFLLDTDEGRGVFIRLKEGAVDEWSFGYDALDVDYDEVTSDGARKTVRNLRTIRLYEYSPVLWGMNPATATLSAKETAEQKPWDIFVEDDEYCIYRIDDEGERIGDTLGCHPTEEEARAQVRALYAQEESAREIAEELKGLLGQAAAIVSAAKAVSLDQRLQRIRSTFYEAYPDTWPDEDGDGVRHVWYVREVFDEYLIVAEQLGDEWHLWQVPYEASDEDVTIGPRDEWIEGEMVFVPLGERDASSSAPAQQAASDSQPDEKAGPGSTEETPPTSERLEEIKRHLLEIDLREVSDGLQRDAGEGPTAVPGGEGDPGG